MPIPQRVRPSPERVDAVPVAVTEEATPAWTARNGSPVHALQARIGEAWEADAAPGARQICLSRLALIGALGLAAWVPVAGAAALLAR